jgi:hypothetical protein
MSRISQIGGGIVAQSYYGDVSNSTIAQIKYLLK